MVNSDLPQEILAEIFLKLPTKFIGKCRCLSKTWNSELSAPDFINLHSTTRKTRANDTNIILVTQSRSLYVIMKNNEVLREIELPNTWPTSILGSCDGLVLLRCQNQKLVLLNPITHKQVTLPDSAIDLSEDILTTFGYGYSRDDHKVVKLFRDMHVLDVYSVRQGICKSFCLPYSKMNGVAFPVHVVMPFVNHSVHWWFTTIESTSNYNYNCHISVFDLTTETFKEVLLPTGFRPYPAHAVLVILGRCLCIVDTRQLNCTDVWVMKEYGVVDSWVRFRIGYGRIRPVCFVEDGKLLSITHENDWVLCDLEDGTVKQVVGGGIPVTAAVRNCGTFVDSLVDPEQCLSS